MSTQFPAGPTRNIQPGDTPDLNDGLLSRLIADTVNLVRGQACYLVAGEITVGTQALSLAGHSPFVPIESVDNTADGLQASGITAPQRIAVTIRFDTTDGLTINPGDYLKISDATAGQLHRWNDADVDAAKYARFLGIEAALLDRDILTPFDETLTPGIVPDQSVTGLTTETFVGWVQLMENSTV